MDIHTVKSDRQCPHTDKQMCIHTHTHTHTLTWPGAQRLCVPDPLNMSERGGDRRKRGREREEGREREGERKSGVRG